MFSLLQKRAFKVFPKLLPYPAPSFQSSRQLVNQISFKFSSSQLRNARPDMLYAGAAVLLSITGLTYGIVTSAEAKELAPTEQVPPTKLTKKEAKLLIEEALKYDAQGDNEKAMELYQTAYRVYRRANKASNNKLTLLRQRIAILTSFQGRNKKAVLTLMEGFESAEVKILTEALHFELYYDLCVMYYKFGQYMPSTVMFKSCLDLAHVFYPEETEILAAIHQFLGFSYYKRGQQARGEEHLTKALKYLNVVKIENKAFLYYTCNEFCDFYTSMGDYKKALLFLEQARVLLNQESFFDPKTIERGIKIHSPYTQKFIKDLRMESQVKQLDGKASMLRQKLGDYNLNNIQKNHTINKLTRREKDTSVHGLLKW